jgi:hypothetical protein
METVTVSMRRGRSRRKSGQRRNRPSSLHSCLIRPVRYDTFIPSKHLNIVMCVQDEPEREPEREPGDRGGAAQGRKKLCRDDDKYSPGPG